MSLENLAVAALKKDYPCIRRGGFSKDMRKSVVLLSEKHICDENCFDFPGSNKCGQRVMDDFVYEELMGGFKRVPDAHMIDLIEKDVFLFEIEDTSKLTESKLRDYSNLWFSFDSEMWGLYLYTTDRYGKNVTEINLCDCFYSFLDLDTNPIKMKKLSNDQIECGRNILKKMVKNDYPEPDSSY